MCGTCTACAGKTTHALFAVLAMNTAATCTIIVCVISWFAMRCWLGVSRYCDNTNLAFHGTWLLRVAHHAELCGWLRANNPWFAVHANAQMGCVTHHCSQTQL